jgi:hypothetical protein
MAPPLRRVCCASALLALAAVAPNCSAPPPASSFSLTSIVGGAWYEILRVQTAGGNALQQFCACTALYFSDDAGNQTRGNLDVLNSCRWEAPGGAFVNATSYLTGMSPDGHWTEQYFPGGPPASYNIILTGTDARGADWIVEYDCSNNALFGDNYCIHLLSRLPTGFPQALLDEIVVETTVVMGLNPQLRPLNKTRQDGCW